MKRDMELIRRIVLATTDLAPGQRLENIEGVDDATFCEHAKLMLEANLIEAIIHGDDDGYTAHISRLTWEGQDFANAVASDTLWAKAKQSVIKPGASFTFGVLRDWLKHEIAQGFPTVRTLN